MGWRISSAMLAEAVAPARVLIYGGPAGFLDAANDRAITSAGIASANWHATAALGRAHGVPRRCWWTWVRPPRT